MKLLEERIQRDGLVLPGDVLKVDSFLNHQMDVELLCEMGKEFARLYEGCGINKVLTVEASGIAIAAFAASALGCKMVFAKKSRTSNLSADVYHSPVMSYTHGYSSDVMVSRKYLGPDDKVLIVDDFLARGEALKGLIDICNQAGAQVIGCGIAIEKAYQEGGQLIRGKGYRVESLARVASMDPENGIVFC